MSVWCASTSFARRAGPTAVLTLLLTACAAHLADAQVSTGPAAGEITDITVERDCSGCRTGSLLVLRRDGTASFTVTGKARLGTEDKSSRAPIPAGEFDRLARLAVAQGFFALNDAYEDAATQDGRWVTTSITRSGQSKRVFNRGDAGPASLKAVQAAAETLRAQLVFVPDR